MSLPVSFLHYSKTNILLLFCFDFLLLIYLFIIHQSIETLSLLEFGLVLSLISFKILMLLKSQTLPWRKLIKSPEPKFCEGISLQGCIEGRYPAKIDAHHATRECKFSSKKLFTAFLLNVLYT